MVKMTVMAMIMLGKMWKNLSEVERVYIKKKKLNQI